MAIHHAVAKKAAKHGIKLIDQGHGVYIATDTLFGDRKMEGTDATKLLTDVMAARNEAGSTTKKVKKAPAAKKAAKPAKKSRKSDDEGDEGDEGAEEGEEEGDEEEASGSMVKAKYRAIYSESTVPDSNDDELAEALHEYLTVEEEMDFNRLKIVAKANDVDISRWAGKNPGHVRMIVGNVLRGMWKKGKDIVVGSRTIKGVKQEKKS